MCVLCMQFLLNDLATYDASLICTSMGVKFPLDDLSIYSYDTVHVVSNEKCCYHRGDYSLMRI